MILGFLYSIVSSSEIQLKSNEIIKDLFKNLNNFKVTNFLSNSYIFKNKFSKTIF